MAFARTSPSVYGGVTPPAGQREIWLCTDVLDGEASHTYNTTNPGTGSWVKATTQELSEGFIDIVILLGTIVGTPLLTAAATVVNGYLQVVVTNNAVPGNTATYTLVIENRHSTIR